MMKYSFARSERYLSLVEMALILLSFANACGMSLVGIVPKPLMTVETADARTVAPKDHVNQRALNKLC